MAIQINIDNVWGQLTDDPGPEVTDAIIAKTKYRPIGYDKKWSFKHGKWDGWAHTYDPQNRSFRVGLLQRIINVLKSYSIDHNISYIGPSDCTHIPSLTIPPGTIKYFECQSGVKNVVHTNSRGIITGPTGSGKTVMVALLLEELQNKTLIVLNDLVLLDQMHANLSRYFPAVEIGMIGDGEFILKDVTVATVQSLCTILGIIKTGASKRGPSERAGELKQWLESVDVIVHDEAHLADADTCLHLYAAIPHASKIYGFTATPYFWANKQQKGNNIELEQVFGTVIYSTFDIDFIALGLRVPCIVKTIQLPAKVSVYGTFRDNQAELYKKCLQFEIIDNPVWHQAIVDIVAEYTEAGLSCFVYAAHSLEYGEKLAKLLNAPFVQGKTPRKQRRAHFQAVQDKKQLVIVSDIGGIGLDIPSLDVFILASDTKDIRQMRGRVERACPGSGKKSGILVDIWKDCSFLKSHHKLRLNQYEEAGNLVT